MQLRRFRSLRRGYGSFLILVFLSGLALFAEFFVGSRALLVRYDGRLYCPTYGAIHPGRDFGLGYAYETDYRALRAKFAGENAGNWVLMPVVPYGPNEDCYPGQSFLPRPPDGAHRHFFGTDQINRDILARLLYGLRNSLVFSVGFVALVYLIGVVIGCSMGYFGGWLDLGMQRFIEIWSLLPFLLVVIIVRAAHPPGTQFGAGPPAGRGGPVCLDGNDLLHAKRHLPREGPRLRCCGPGAGGGPRTRPVSPRPSQYSLDPGDLPAVLVLRPR